MVQVVRCCLEHAASVAKTFLTCDAVVVDIKEPFPFRRKTLMPMPTGTQMPVPMPTRTRMPVPTQTPMPMRMRNPGDFLPNKWLWIHLVRVEILIYNGHHHPNHEFNAQLFRFWTNWFVESQLDLDYC